MLFGPAYKGIVLAAATAIALADQHGRDLPWAYNRKEAKDHGEGGVLVGAPLKGRVLIVDDVMTAGTAMRESLALIRAQGATPAGVLIALDRQERGQTRPFRRPGSHRRVRHPGDRHHQPGRRARLCRRTAGARVRTRAAGVVPATVRRECLNDGALAKPITSPCPASCQPQAVTVSAAILPPTGGIHA